MQEHFLCLIYSNKFLLNSWIDAAFTFDYRLSLSFRRRSTFLIFTTAYTASVQFGQNKMSPVNILHTGNYIKSMLVISLTSKYQLVMNVVWILKLEWIKVFVPRSPANFFMVGLVYGRSKEKSKKEALNPITKAP